MSRQHSVAETLDYSYRALQRSDVGEKVIQQEFVRPQKCCSFMISNLFRGTIVALVIFDIFQLILNGAIIVLFFCYECRVQFLDEKVSDETR